MGFYDDFILPRLIDLAMRNKQLLPFRERVIGAGFFSGKQPTLMFNGYEKQVAHLYTGMDLRKNF